MTPLSRIFADTRLAAVPLAILAVANLVMLGLVLGPLAGRVQTLEQRATTAALDAQAAQRDLDQARALAVGKTRATDDLQTFYTQVLPVGQSEARRLTFLRLAQVARGAGLDYDRRSFAQESERDARLIRMDMAMVVRGRYDQLRRFFHDVEAGEDFVVIRGVTVGQKSETPGELEATLQISTFYKAPDGR